VHKALGIELPGALTVIVKGETSLQWMGPDEWLLIVPAVKNSPPNKPACSPGRPAHPDRQRQRRPADPRTERPERAQVLMKSTSYDVHPNNFPVGKAVGTVFAKSQLVIRHTAEDTWELLIRRSFSDYWWLWLQDVGRIRSECCLNDACLAPQERRARR
jgi:sarcosine oxidase subunit gamma